MNEYELGFPKELDYEKCQATYEEIFGEGHGPVASYWVGDSGKLRSLCCCGSVHELKKEKLEGVVNEEECFCGHDIGWTGPRCFGCPHRLSEG